MTVTANARVSSSITVKKKRSAETELLIPGRRMPDWVSPPNERKMVKTLFAQPWHEFRYHFDKS